MTQATMTKPLVLGVGNLLMGDEGIGVVAVREMEKLGLGDRVELVDGGTGGFHLLELFMDRPRMILIDATMDGKPPGTVSLLRPKFAKDFPPSLSAHDIGLKDLIESAALLGKLPEVLLVTISIDSLSSLSLELSEPVKAALPRIESTVKKIIDEWHAESASTEGRQTTSP
jgi:hydrogenase maturation protease